MTDYFQKASVTSDLAERLIEAAKREAEQVAKPFVIAVVDEAGDLKAVARMDGARGASVSVAVDKAFTATSGRPTHKWHEVLERDEVLGRGGQHAIKRLVSLGGGYPITVDGHLVGGLGVAGGHYSEDMRCAEAALASCGLQSQW